MHSVPLRPRDVSDRIARLAVGLALAGSAGCALFGPTTATSFLTIIERNPDPNARYKAFRSLASPNVYDDPSQKARAVKTLIDRLDPAKEPLASRAMICRTLGTLGDPAAREPMLRLVRDQDPLLRAEACRTLGLVGRPEDATVLMQVMKLDGDPNCKVAALESLGLLRAADPRTSIYLVEEMESDDPAIRLAALESLRKITKKDLGVNPGPWREYVLSLQITGKDAPAKVDRSTKPASTSPKR